MYPLVVLCVATAIMFGIMTVIVPVFEELFHSFDAELPAPTRVLVNISRGIRHNLPLLIPGLIAAIAALGWWKRSRSGAYTLDRLALSLPIAGELIRKVASARFARAYAQLLRGGVPILSALQTVSGATGNRVAAGVLLNAMKSVERGDSLSTALQGGTVFPDTLVEMLRAGEQSGKVDEMLDCIAEFYEDEVDAALAGMTAMLEPLPMRTQSGWRRSCR